LVEHEVLEGRIHGNTSAAFTFILKVRVASSHDSGKALHKKS